MKLTRARFLQATAALVAAGALPVRDARAAAPGATMQTRKIPSSGALLPVVGLGTWRGFDVGASPQERAPLAEVLAALFESGGTVIDTSPMYGEAERVVGDLLAGALVTEGGARGRAFLATKVWTSGRAQGERQMTRSLELLRTERIELMQIHNLVDWRTHLPTLRDWKARSKARYIGVTHYTASAHDELARVLRAEPFDFVQINYALDDRAAEQTILPLAADKGVAVLVNQPFGGGDLLRRALARPLPEVAREVGAASWAQLLLKFVLGHPAVTCVIPGTSKAKHMRDNAAAGTGVMPDEKLRARIVAALA